MSLAGERLIGGAQTQVTDTTGAYRFDRLSPGTYQLKFELQGFRPLERTDIVVNTSFVATVPVKLEVGAVSESITVTGESPTVDVRSSVQQTVMNQDILEGVPTGRDPWSLAKLIPGVQVATYDVGGATMIYYGQGMFDEVNYMTSSIPAEVMAGGVSINMVTKDGGNMWKGNARYSFANDSLQAENWAAMCRRSR